MKRDTELLFSEPNVKDPADIHLAALYRTNREAYDATIREHVKKFAM